MTRGEKGAKVGKTGVKGFFVVEGERESREKKKRERGKGGMWTRSHQTNGASENDAKKERHGKEGMDTALNLQW